jgi:hypothetical protein
LLIEVPRKLVGAVDICGARRHFALGEPSDGLTELPLLRSEEKVQLHDSRSIRALNPAGLALLNVAL